MAKIVVVLSTVANNLEAEGTTVRFVPAKNGSLGAHFLTVWRELLNDVKPGTTRPSMLRPTAYRFFGDRPAEAQLRDTVKGSKEYV